MGAAHAVRRAPLAHRAGFDYQSEGPEASIESAGPPARVNHIDREPWLRRLRVRLLVPLEGNDYVAGGAVAASRMCGQACTLSPGLPGVGCLPGLGCLPCLGCLARLSRLACFRGLSCLGGLPRRSRRARRCRCGAGHSRLSLARRRCGRRLPGRLLGRILRGATPHQYPDNADNADEHDDPPPPVGLRPRLPTTHSGSMASITQICRPARRRPGRRLPRPASCFSHSAPTPRSHLPGRRHSGALSPGHQP